MPYKSKSQGRYFHYLEEKGKLPKKTVDEFDHETNFDDLPEKAHMAYGGEVPENFDEETGREEEYDSSGEPDTEDEMEDRHPMEYMSKGGRVKRMAKGGMIGRPEFARALMRRVS